MADVFEFSKVFSVPSGPKNAYTITCACAYGELLLVGCDDAVLRIFSSEGGACAAALFPRLARAAHARARTFFCVLSTLAAAASAAAISLPRPRRTPSLLSRPASRPLRSRCAVGSDDSERARSELQLVDAIPRFSRERQGIRSLQVVAEWGVLLAVVGAC